MWDAAEQRAAEAAFYEKAETQRIQELHGQRESWLRALQYLQYLILLCPAQMRDAAEQRAAEAAAYEDAETQRIQELHERQAALAAEAQRLAAEAQQVSRSPCLSAETAQPCLVSQQTLRRTWKST